MKQERCKCGKIEGNSWSLHRPECKKFEPQEEFNEESMKKAILGLEKAFKKPKNHSPQGSSLKSYVEGKPAGTLLDKAKYDTYYDGVQIFMGKDIKEFIKDLNDIPLTAEQLAKEFHNNYENFSINNQWKTQDKCQVAFDDLPEKNKQTMIDTCQHILLWIEAIMLNKRRKLAGKDLI